MNRLLLLVLHLCIGITGYTQGFIHRDQQNIVDGQGKNIILRGLGLGGWMVQEGYMLQTSDFAGPQHVIKQKITELIGSKDTEAFYKAYRTNGITKRDIDSLAAWGFNSVRLPMHYNLYTPAIEDEKNGKITWIEEGFALTDKLLEWCAANKMYLILDLHAAPGGQGRDANISDYDPKKPSLWESQANQDKMIALWQKLASRYKDHPWLGAYDIINEPNYNFTGTNLNGCDETKNGPLRALLIATTKAIRAVDKNHLIFIEGNCWGNNYSGIFPLWDDNLALSFHKYWNYNTQASLQTMLDYRAKYNVPIWLGESGENSNVWFRDVIKLVEENNIGWAFWPMKKIDNITGISSVTKTPQYERLLQYWKNGGTKPTASFAKKTLMGLAENYKTEHLTIKYDVIDAMFRQVQSQESKPFKNHTLPCIIFSTDYDLGTQGTAYFDTDYADYKVDTGKFGAWNKGNSYRNDGVDITPCTATTANGFKVSHISDGEWLQYTINNPKTATYTLKLQYSSLQAGAKVQLTSNGKTVVHTIEFPATGDFEKYKTLTVPGVKLEAGVQKLKFIFEKDGLDFLSFAFEL